MGKVRILEQTIKNPLTFMGECAGIAYDSDTSDSGKNSRRGLNCVNAGHGRMWEFCDVFVEIDGYSVRFARELMRHVGDGLTCIQRSTRYVNETGFDFYTPDSIEKDKYCESIYFNAMYDIELAYHKLIGEGIPKEDAANLLPLGMNTTLVMKHNARTWIQMAEVRLCNRTLKEYRDFMKEFMKELRDYSDEWKIVVDNFFICKCDKTGACDEEYSCGKYPKL